MKTRFLPLYILLFFLLACVNDNGKSKQTEKALQGPDREEFVMKRGVNISHWLSQSDKRGKARREWFQEDDIAYIANLGYEHIRLPIDEEQLWDKQGNKVQEAFDLLHKGISWCKTYNLRTVVDLHVIRAHHFNREERPLWTDPEAQEKFLELWRDLSAELKQYKTGQVAYELMNEAVAEDPEDWNRLIAKTIQVIRKEEPERKIVVGSNRWQSVHTFDDLKIPDDENLILSFHFYIPFLLTHHQASWTNIADYEGPVNYPGQTVPKAQVENLSGDLKQAVQNHNQHFTRDTLEKYIMKPVKYAKKHNLPLYCGEWGCYPTVPDRIRLQWYRDVRSILEKHGIAWANWNYKGGFGIVRNDRTPNKKLIDILLNGN